MKMAYHSKKYAKFQTKDKVKVVTEKETLESIISQVFLDLTNDEWLYRVKDFPSWLNEKNLEKIEVSI